MNAPKRVLTIISHQEADRVPAFESTFTNNKIMKHYGIIPEKGDSDIFKEILDKKNNFNKCYIKSHELFCKIGIDIVTTLSSLYPIEALSKGEGFIDEYERIMKYEYYKDGFVILGYHGGVFKNFEDYESWEKPEPNW